MSKAQELYNKLYAPLVRPYLPIDIGEPTHEFWINNLEEGNCQTLALWKKKVPYITIQREKRPCCCSNSSVPECYKSISDLGWAWWLFVIKQLPLGLRGRHLHGSHQFEPAIVTWDERIELRLAGEDVLAARTAYIPGPTEAKDRTSHHQASFAELRKSGRYTDHPPWIKQRSDGINGGNK